MSNTLALIMASDIGQGAANSRVRTLLRQNSQSEGFTSVGIIDPSILTNADMRRYLSANRANLELELGYKIATNVSRSVESWCEGLSGVIHTIGQEQKWTALRIMATELVQFLEFRNYNIIIISGARPLYIRSEMNVCSCTMVTM